MIFIFSKKKKDEGEGGEQAVENYYIKLNYYYVEIMKAAISFHPEHHKFPPQEWNHANPLESSRLEPIKKI